MRLAATSALALLLALASHSAHATTYDLKSPNGRVGLHVDAPAGARPTLAVVYAGQPVVTRTELGLDIRGGALSGDGMTVTGAKTSQGVDDYRLMGPASHVHARYNQLTLSLRQGGDDMQVVVRAYDDGAAFRYIVPATKTRLEITGEATQFHLAGDDDCFAMVLPDEKTSHEGDFLPTKLSALKDKAFIDNPLVCKMSNGAVAFAEADVENYAGAYFKGTGDGIAVNLSPRPDTSGDAVIREPEAGPLRSPWRVMMLGDSAGALTQSTLVYSLAAPSRVADTAWIAPGKSAWDWWNGFAVDVPHPGANTETYKAYIDFAQRFGLNDFLIDDGWYKGSLGNGTYRPTDDITQGKDGIDMPALVAYAKARGVGLLLWVHWTPLDEHMDAVMSQYERWGIKGIKVDFMDRNDQDMVAFYHRVLAAGARHHLMVDLHGAYPPNGLARTYPNFVTQEGIMGAEYNKWSDRVTATHNVNLAYTRMLLGPADYTPGGFRNLTPEVFATQKRSDRPFVQTTRGQALGLYVAMQSPLMMVADSPDAYIHADGSLEPGADFVKSVPVTWDETRFVAGDIGQYIAIARRKGTQWTIGLLNTEQGRTVSLPLSFLGKGAYTAKIYADGATPMTLDISQREVTAATRLEMALKPSGGGAVVLTPFGKSGTP